MNKKSLRIVLADDSDDDCMLFKEALNEIAIPASLTIVQDGEELMKFLATMHKQPDVLFLDLNMPRKNGYECMQEIRNKMSLVTMPVVIISTSCNERDVNMLYDRGATYYIRKPNSFDALVEMIEAALTYVQAGPVKQPAKDNFLITLIPDKLSK